MTMIDVFIPARGGSKGIPKKNIKIFAGKPLIVHTIEYAMQSNLINEIFVSTDDIQISKIAKQAGANVINRPKELATDSATTESAIEHFIETSEKKRETIVLLQPTSPVRPKGSLDQAIYHFQKGGYDSLLSISPTHRFFWRINEDNSVFAEYDYINRPRRQDINRTNMRFLENGSLYIFKCKHFLKTKNRLGGKISYVEWPEEFSYEIDTLLEFNFVEQIYKNLIS